MLILQLYENRVSQFWIILSLFLSACALSTSHIVESDYTAKIKIKGMHVFSTGYFDSLNMIQIEQLNVNHLVLVPYFYQKGLNTHDLKSSAINGYEWTERDEGIKQISLDAKNRGMKIIVKPHLWPYKVEGEGWRESVMPDSANWNTWSERYRDGILHYAELSEEYGIDVLCIGTELKRLSLERPDFWKSLIYEVRKVYKGKLTYAANWYEEFEKIEFWSDLDYIGIQAYFPLSNRENPEISDIKKGWEPHKEKITLIAQKFNKPVLFTEMGYKSTSNAAIEPWLWDEHWNQKKDLGFTISEETQANCYRAFFDTFWKEDWFTGVLIWNWKTAKQEDDFYKNASFSPKNKMSEQVIKENFEN